ncbi:MAG TPA: TetR/AcrR family transcriptional regulator [Polyangia bacterium]|jgi:AcrR family transcriptional regulator
MPRPRFAKLPPARREQILDTAAREFGLHGFEDASLNHILAAAGLSKGAAYYYFDDKADLFVATVRHFWEHFLAHTGIATIGLDRDSFWPRVVELYRHALDHYRADPALLGVAKAVWRLAPESRREGRVAELFGWARDQLAAVVHQGQQVGAIRRDLPDELLLGVVLALDEAADRWTLEHADQLETAHVEEVLTRLLAGVRLLLAPPEDAS